MKTLKQFVAESAGHPGKAIVDNGGGHKAFINNGWSHEIEKDGDGIHDIHTYKTGRYITMGVKHRKTGKMSNWIHEKD